MRLAPLLLLALLPALSGCAVHLHGRGRVLRNIAKGGQVSANDALCAAAANGWLDLMKQALAKGASPDGLSSDGFLPVLYAANNNQPQALKLLVDNGANTEPLFEKGSGRTLGERETDTNTLEYAVSLRRLEMVELLRRYQEALAPRVASAAGAARREPVDPEAGPMVRAVGAGDLAAVKALLDGGMEPDSRVEDRKTGLHLAAEADRPEIARLLLSRGANPDARNEDGWTPLMVAAHSGSEGVARALLQARADADARLDDGGNAAAIAEVNGHPRIAKLLAQAGAPASKPHGDSAERGSDVDAPSYRGKPRPDDIALVVGVGSYSRLPEATYAERDAEAAARHFEALGVPKRNVVTLSGSAATRGALQGYLEEWLPRNAKPGSTVFVYFSGHGAPDPKTGEAFLVPWDGDPSFLNSTAIPLKSLYAALGKLPAKSVVVALDACFSGAGGRSVLARGARPLVAKAEAVAPPAKLTVFAAASGDEITGGLDAESHGLFTYFFLKGFSEGKRSAKDLFEYLKPLVQDEARRQNREQTPVLLGEGVSL